VVVLVRSADEQRVFLGNAGGRQTGEELAEGDVILPGLRDVAGLAGPKVPDPLRLS
jgi:hypothetical protein